MPRVDVWDIAKAREAPPIEAGFDGMDKFDERFTWGKQLGKGGFGNVRVVTDRRTGTEFACKSIPKRLDAPGLSPERQAAHVENIRREVAVLRRLRGTLNVVALEGAFEDESEAHVVMELCRGGELLHAIAHRPHYSEMTVASFMRAVLRTLAQCHTHRILHRDVKPGNFMLLSDSDDAPLKAIDFGLAAFFDPQKLPRTDLGLEGTPWFMAPEVLSSKVGPEADVWSAGVMAYQLLCGRLPFDDASSPDAPALSVIWKGILTQQPSFRGSTWGSISDAAKDFVSSLLKKEPKQRPTAKEALAHPWVSQGGDAGAAARALGVPLRAQVVQRIQRFGQANPLRRTIFELIAAELLKMQPAEEGEDDEGGGGGGGGESPTMEAEAATAAAAPSTSPAAFSLSPSSGSGGGSLRIPKSTSSGDLLRAVRAEAAAAAAASAATGTTTKAASPPAPSPRRATQSLHGGKDYWRIMRAAAAAHRLAARVEEGGGSMRGGGGGGGESAAAAASGLQRLRLSKDGAGEGGRRPSADFPLSPATAAAATMDIDDEGEGARGKRGEGTTTSEGATTTAAAEEENLGEPGLFYARTAPRSERERAAARKAARLALDTSSHGGASYSRLVRAFEGEAARDVSVHGGAGGSLRGLTAFGRTGDYGEDEGDELRHKPPSGERGGGGGVFAGGGPPPAAALRPSSAAEEAAAAAATQLPPLSPSVAVEMGGRRRQGAYAAFLSASGEGGGAGDDGEKGLPSPQQQQAVGRRPSTDGRRVTFSPVVKAEAPPVPARTAAEIIEEEERRKEAGRGTNDDDGAPTATTVSLKELRDVMRALNFSRDEEAVTAGALADGLARLGYELEPSEARVLAEQVARFGGGGGEDDGGAPAPATAAERETGGGVKVPKAAFVASQLDWGSIATNYRDQWLAAAEKVFGDLREQAAASSAGGGGGGGGGDGASATLPASALTAALRDKLPAAEVAHAVEDALLATGKADAEALDFEGFLRMLRCGGVVGASGGSGRGGSGAAAAASGAAKSPSVDGSVHAGLEFFDSRFRGVPGSPRQQQQKSGGLESVKE